MSEVSNYFFCPIRAGEGCRAETGIQCGWVLQDLRYRTFGEWKRATVSLKEKRHWELFLDGVSEERVSKK